MLQEIPTNPAGMGPFKNEDGDLCGEGKRDSPSGVQTTADPANSVC